ncbi:10778_t:CDS:2, partial [Cetraspora pellucida]
MNYNNSSSSSNLLNENCEEFTLKELIENNKRKKALFLSIYQTVLYSLNRDVELNEIQRALLINQINITIECQIARNTFFQKDMDLNEELKKTLENNQIKKLLFSTIYQTILYNLDYGQPRYTEIFRENIQKIVEIKQEIRKLSKDDLLEYIET